MKERIKREKTISMTQMWGKETFLCHIVTFFFFFRENSTRFCVFYLSKMSGCLQNQKKFPPIVCLNSERKLFKTKLINWNWFVHWMKFDTFFEGKKNSRFFQQNKKKFSIFFQQKIKSSFFFSKQKKSSWVLSKENFFYEGKIQI